MQEVILFYNGLDVQTRHILDSKGAIPSKTTADAKVLQERGFGSLPSSTEANPRDHVKSISTTAEADSNLIRRIGSPEYAVSTSQNRRFMFESRQKTIPFPCRLNDYYYEEKKGSYRLVCFDNALADLGDSVTVMPLSTYLNLHLGKLAHTKLTIELADRTVKYPKGITENILVGIGKFVFPIDFIIPDMPEDVKVPLILGRLFLSTAHAKIDVFKRKITLRVGDEKIIFKSVKPASSLIKRVYISLDPLYGDYIEFNDLNVPLELRRDKIDDLMPTIKEGEVIDEHMIHKIKTRNNESFDEYLSFCDFDRKIHIDCAYNLRFACMIVENMDGYQDQDMRDIILEEPFCKASCVKENRFDRLITIHNGSGNVTYQMARSHPRFKHLSNAQCNKIKPFLKVNLHDNLNGISHPYQKLKGFYKGVLNLGPEYIRDAKIEEWLKREHISVHEME
ncbi:retrovirus-related pol polyprotein from transposon TNT 1-94 [Tanacetum coccineum]